MSDFITQEVKRVLTLPNAKRAPNQAEDPLPDVPQPDIEVEDLEEADGEP